MIVEPEVLVARRGFVDAQAGLDGVGVSFAGTYYSLGWYGTRVSQERGSFCVVNSDGPLADLVGDILRFRVGANTSALAYCVASSPVPYDVAVTRRVFAAFGVLSVATLPALVEVVS